MILTSEQQTVVDSFLNGKNLKVQALAGTGKTSTLVAIARNCPDKKGLYLVYNASMKKEAQSKFPDTVDVKTSHSLAYPYMGKQIVTKSSLFGRINYEAVVKKTSIDNLITISDSRKFTRTLMIRIDSRWLIAVAGSFIRKFEFSNTFLFTSPDFVQECERSLKSKIVKELYKRQGKFKKLDEAAIRKKLSGDKETAAISSLNLLILQMVVYPLWQLRADPYDRTYPASHETYIKLYQLSKPVIEDYDYIMLDEAQDSNACLLDIVSRQNCQTILVGDDYQQIYEYRGTRNILRSFNGEELFLTQSFRFGQSIADCANKCLSSLGCKDEHLLKGAEGIDSKVSDIYRSVDHYFSDEVPSSDFLEFIGHLPKPLAIISRTNAGLFYAIGETVEDYKIYVEGDISDTINLLDSSYTLFDSKYEPTKKIHKDIKGVFTWDELLVLAGDEEAQELMMCSNVIDAYKERTPSLIKTLMSLKQDRKSWEILFTTAHKAKGLEWDNVLLLSNFRSTSAGELRLKYVARTRAKKNLFKMH